MERLGEATAGGAAGVFSVGCMYPLVVVKTKLQAQRKEEQLLKHEVAEADHYKNPIDCLIKIVKREGIKGLFKGISSSLPKAFVTNFIFYYFHAALKPFFQSFTKRVGPFLGNMIHGICTGACVQVIMTPSELVNTRVIADKTGKLHFWDSFREIVDEKGLIGLYQGIIPALVLTINPGITNVVRHWITPSGAAASNAENFWSGAASKACASFITYPYVLAKIQIFTFKKAKPLSAQPVKVEKQDSVETEDLNQRRELTILGVLSRIYKEEGIPGLYKGCEMQVGIAVAKEAILNMARFPIKFAIMSLFVENPKVGKKK